MSGYTQLTQEERHQIHILKRLTNSVADKWQERQRVTVLFTPRVAHRIARAIDVAEVNLHGLQHMRASRLGSNHVLRSDTPNTIERDTLRGR